MFIFDRGHRSSATVTPVKYECDANNLTGTFARSKILLMEKLTNGALVTPTPGYVGHTGENEGTRSSRLVKEIVRWYRHHGRLVKDLMYWYKHSAGLV